jgi:hypothetical protein
LGNGVGSCWRCIFLILPKIVDWEVVSGTVGDALIAYNDNAIVVCLPQGSTAQHIMTAVF